MTPARARLLFTLSAIPASFAASGAVARALLAHAPPSAAPDLAQPLAVVTGWGAAGAGMWALLAAAVCAASLACLSALRQLRIPAFGPRATLVALCATAVCAVGAALAWPVLFSSDVYAYAAYGDLAARGFDPGAPLARHASDPLVAAAVWQWRGTLPVCVYGGAFVAIARAIVAATAGFGIAATLLAFRLAACVAFLLACVALYYALPRSTARARTVAVLALNPVAIWCAAEGHNDAFMVALAIAGVALVRAWGPLAGGIAIGLASAIKAPGVAAGAVLAGATAFGPRSARLRMYAAFGAAAIVACALGLPRATEAAHAIGRHGVYAPQFSLQALVIAALQPLLPHAATAVGSGLTLAALLGLAAVAYRAIRGGNRGAWAWLTAIAWLAIPNPYPWYALWILPVAAALCDLPVFAVLYGATFCVVLRYLPDAFGPLAADQQILVTLLELLPFALLVGPLPRPLPGPRDRVAMRALTLALAPLLLAASVADPPSPAPTVSPSPAPATASPQTVATPVAQPPPGTAPPPPPPTAVPTAPQPAFRFVYTPPAGSTPALRARRRSSRSTARIR